MKNGYFQRFCNIVDGISEKTGKLASYIIFIIMAFTATEVISRYVFNNPTMWVWPLNRQLFGLFILFAGVYATLKKEHIRIEILYDYLPAKLKLMSRIIGLLAFTSFIGVLIWQGTWMGWNSFNMSEKAAGAFRIPLWPLKILVPVVCCLFFLQGIVAFLRRESE
jgi:TRAP-type mannitol/chloroaromatic compound transport system permease small subunit